MWGGEEETETQSIAQNTVVRLSGLEEEERGGRKSREEEEHKLGQRTQLSPDYCAHLKRRRLGARSVPLFASADARHAALCSRLLPITVL